MRGSPIDGTARAVWLDSIAVVLVHVNAIAAGILPRAPPSTPTPSSRSTETRGLASALMVVGSSTAHDSASMVIVAVTIPCSHKHIRTRPPTHTRTRAHRHRTERRPFPMAATPDTPPPRPHGPASEDHAASTARAAYTRGTGAHTQRDQTQTSHGGNAAFGRVRARVGASSSDIRRRTKPGTRGRLLSRRLLWATSKTNNPQV